MVLSLAACASIPADPDGTLEHVGQSAVLRVGASPSSGLVSYEGEDVTGQEAELDAGLAESLGAEDVLVAAVRELPAGVRTEPRGLQREG